MIEVIGFVFFWNCEMIEDEYVYVVFGSYRRRGGEDG